MQPSLLSQRVYDELYSAMLTDRLGPGDRLNRKQVAEDYGVSVAPVLEAMTQLEWEGFLVTAPRRGTMVRSVTASEVLGRFHLRIAIETQAARIYAGPRLAAEAARMRELAAAVDATPNGTRESVEAEMRFHGGLVNLAGSDVLSDTFRQVMRFSLYYAAKKVLPQGPPRPPREHIRLVDNILTCGPEEADRVIRRHLEPWIELLTPLAAHEPQEIPKVDARGRPKRLTLRRKIRTRRS